MFYATNKKTGKRVHSLWIYKDGSYQTPEEETWLADSDEIQNYEETKKRVGEIEVLYRKEKDCVNYRGTRYGISPHFFIPNRKKKGINIIPESREHKIAKNWIYNIARQEDSQIELYYSTIKEPYHYINPVKIKDLPLDYENTSFKEEVRISLSNKTRIADVLVPFYYSHPFLGNGIVFEIQFSKQREETKEERSFEWAHRGFSVCWIYEKDFEYLTKTLIALKEDLLRVDSFSVLIHRTNKNGIRNLRITVQDELRLIDKKVEEAKKIIYDGITKLENKKEELSQKYNKECKDLFNTLMTANVQRRIIGICAAMTDGTYEQDSPICPQCHYIMQKKKRRDNGIIFWSCIRYPECKGSLSFLNKQRPFKEVMTQ